ncbi:MAG TPA: Rv3235 family protein [Nocardioidaceae bacterium]|nr:Rv3235 family protein [Nocardioidaceae bacterium]
MTTAHDCNATRALRRPPAAPAQWATVTHLGLGPGEHTPAPTAPPAVDGSLALKEPTPRPVAQGAPQTPELRLVPGGRSGEEVQLWAARFAQAVVEVLGGDRPLSQLVRWTSHRVYVELDRRLKILARSSHSGRRTRTIRPQVRSVHVCHPTAESAEVSVHVRYGQRSRAIAARLDLVGGRWQCTALQLG